MVIGFTLIVTSLILWVGGLIAALRTPTERFTKSVEVEYYKYLLACVCLCTMGLLIAFLDVARRAH